MSVIAPPSPVDVRPDLTPEEFYAEYVNRKPVLIPGALAHLPATARWSLDYFASIAGDLEVRVKTGMVADGVTASMRLSEYRDLVADWEQKAATGQASGPPPPYLHDLPLLKLIPGLSDDLEPFPKDFFPPFFAKQWQVFPQFFVGPSQALTTLHFDTLLTHNLFFQFQGHKRFVMVDAADRERCYMYKWRWSNVKDPENVDFDRHPLFRGVELMSADVRGGDLFYMPPGTLHHVTSHEASVSFNIDWHDKVSALRGLTAVRHGMPVQNLRYNILFALGVWGRVPLKALMPALRSYFYYIS